jgi:chromosome segregation ATPase
LSISPSTIRRRCDQGLDSIVRLVTRLEDRIDDLSSLHVGEPQRLIRSQAAQLKRLEQTIHNKDAELTQAHHLNRQLQQRIRELEKILEADIRFPNPL